jgi:hypothetical protein
MRSIYRKALVCLAVALAFGAVASASASASEWYVNGKALSGSAALSETFKVEESILLTFDLSTNETYMKVTCTSVSSYDEGKSEIAAPGILKLGTGSLILRNCQLTMPPAEDEFCELTSPSIEFKALEAKMALGGKSPEDLAEFAKANWTKFWIESTCSWEGGDLFTISGTLTVKVPTGRTESTEQELVFEKAPGLSSEDGPVYITGKIKLKLASGEKWSFH